MLEPKLDPVEAGMRPDDGIAGGKVRRDVGDLDPEAAGEISHPHARARVEVGEDGAFVQHVAPGQDAPALARRREKLGGAVAIGDDQVGHRGAFGGPVSGRLSIPGLSPRHPARVEAARPEPAGAGL